MLIYFPPSNESNMQKVAIFVDVQNVYYTTRQAFQRHFDYQAFWQHATGQRQLVKAFAYAIDRGDAKQRAFQKILQNIGFEVKTKPFIQRSDGSAKGDWDVGITLDVIEYAQDVDVVVLVSGDGDFDLLVHKVRERFGKTVEVYGVSTLSATSLIQAASRFIEIDDPFLLSKK